MAGCGRTAQRGVSESVAGALLLPAVLGILILALQWALHAWASTTALAAAQDGARVAAGYQSDLNAGLRAAGDAISNDVLRAVRITGDRTATTSTVTVSGSARSVIPGLALSITRTVSLPNERLTR